MCNCSIILIRHGQYHQDVDDEELKVLTPLGREQAKKTGKRLAALLEPAMKSAGRKAEQIRIISSTMVRAKETAEIVASELPQGTFEWKDASPLLVEGSPPAHNVPRPLYTPLRVHKSLMVGLTVRCFSCCVQI